MKKLASYLEWTCMPEQISQTWTLEGKGKPHNKIDIFKNACLEK